jgi:hypothetical protein
MKRKVLTSVCAGLLLWAAAIMTAQADTIITFSVNMATNLANGTFNPPPPAGTGSDAIYANGTFFGWAGNGLQLVQEGSGTIWTNSYDDTSDANGHVVSYRFRLASALLGTGYESTASWDNRAWKLPTNSGVSLVLPTPFYGDVGPGQVVNVKFQVDMSEEIQLGNFTKGVNQVDVRGSFNGWVNAGNYITNDPSILTTNGGVVMSNVYVGTFAITTGAQVPGVPATNAFMEWKAVEDIGSGNSVSSWENPGPGNANDAGNRFWNDDTNRVLPIVTFGDLVVTPPAYVTLNVDMSGIIKYDANYVPNSVTVWGTFNNWANGITMTSNPFPNNNVFSSSAITMPENVPVIIQVRYTNSLVGGWVYDYVNDSVYNNNARRTITFPITTTALNTNVPAFYFLDLAPDDYLPKATTVLFSVDMNGAVMTNGTAFNPSSDSVYVNGMFANGGGTPYPQTWYPWSGGINPVSAPPGYQMIREGSSTIYTNTIILPAGTVVGLQYQYGIDPGNANGGPLENEAASGVNHIRVVRTTAVNLYTMPTDTFTNQPYQEPLFAPGNIYEGMGTLAGGQLTVGRPAGGAVPVSWLGRPGAHLQSATGLKGPWTDIWGTDGTNWNSGVNTPNGLMSVTNWPSASGTTLFRLVKP